MTEQRLFLQPEFNHPALAAMEGMHFVFVPGGVRFLDLLTHELFEPSQPPPSVLDNPITGQGLEFLSSLGRSGRVTVELVLAYHGEARDFTDIVEQYGDIPGVRARYRDRGRLAIPHSPDATPLSPSLSSVVVDMCDSGGRAEFQATQLSWLADHNKVVLPSDCFAQEDTLGAAMQHAWDLHQNATDDEATDAPTRNAIRVIAEGCHQATRQWAILGQFGYWLRQADEQGLLATMDAAAVPLILGTGHTTSQERLTHIGVPARSHVTVHDNPDYAEEDAYLSIFNQMMATGMATYDQLAVPLPY